MFDKIHNLRICSQLNHVLKMNFSNSRKKNVLQLQFKECKRSQNRLSYNASTITFVIWIHDKKGIIMHEAPIWNHLYLIPLNSSL